MSNTRKAAPVRGSRGAVELARVALHAAMAGDWDRARDTLGLLSGTQGLVTAISAWCDTAAAAQGLAHDAGPVMPSFREHGTGPERSAGQVPPAVAWAGQVIAARTGGDRETFFALLEAPAAGADLGRHVGTLLQVVALTIKAAGADVPAGTPGGAR